MQLADEDKKFMMQFKAQTLSLFVMDVGLLASLGNPVMKAYGNITVYFININVFFVGRFCFLGHLFRTRSRALG